MDSTYLCRGKRLDNEKWVVGFLSLMLSEVSHMRVKGDDGLYESVRVITSTVGHCTGREDKNGNLIFTGDKLKDSENYIWEVRYSLEYARFEMLCHELRHVRLFDNDELYFSEIIGTIYEEAQPCGN